MRIDATSRPDVRELSARELVDTQDFMTLLVAQLQAQDPLAPMDASEFVAQLAQLQSVAQLNAISGSLTRMRAQQQIAPALALIGRMVGWQDPQSQELTFATVEQVRLANEGAHLLADGRELTLDEVVAVR